MITIHHFSVLSSHYEDVVIIEQLLTFLNLRLFSVLLLDQIISALRCLSSVKGVTLPSVHRYKTMVNFTQLFEQ